MYSLNWGSIKFGAEAIAVEPFDQRLDRIGTDAEISRAQRRGVQQYHIADLSGGLLPDDNNDIHDVNVINRYTYNEGCVTRIPGALLLPEVVTNQASITSDINISGAVAANKRAHGVSTAIGSSVGEQVYYGLDTMFLKMNTTTGAAEVASCNVDAAGANTVLPGQVTAAGILYVSGSPQLALALKDYGIVGTSDPDAATVVFTEIVDGAPDSYVTAIRYLPTIGSGVNIAVGNVDGTNGVWWWPGTDAAATTVKPVVLTDTRTEANPSGVSQATEYGPGRVFENTSAGASGNTNVQNALASDDSDVTGPTAAASYWVLGHDYGVSLPANTLLNGLRLVFEANSSNSNITAWNGGIWLSLSQTAPLTDVADLDQADTDAETWNSDITVTNAGDADYALGSTSRLPMPIKLSDVNENSLFALGIRSSTPSSTQHQIDYGPRLELTYILPGSMPSLPLGGWAVRHNPVTPNTITVVTPTSDEETAYTIPRELWDLSFSYDASGQRPVVTISQPNEGVINIHHAIPFLGGTLISGGLQTGSSNTLTHIASNGQLFSYKFPTEYDNKATKVIWMIPHGIWAIMGVALENSGTIDDYQVWFFNGKNLRLYCDTPLLSLTDNGGANMTISTEPIAFSAAYVSPNLNYIYTIFPNSTDTAVRRERIHNDLAADPRSDNPTWVKQMGFASGTENTYLWCRLPRMAFGPIEANKTITQINTTSPQLDDDTSFGDVTMDISTSGDTTFAAPEVGNLFNTAFETHDITVNGRAYQDMIVRLGLQHEASTAETPNGLGFVLTTKQQWPRLQRYRIRTRRSLLHAYQRNLAGFLEDIDTLSASKNVQPLKIQVDGTEASLVGQVPASFEGVQGINGEPVGELDLMGDAPFEMVFMKIPGKVGA